LDIAKVGITIATIKIKRNHAKADKELYDLNIITERILDSRDGCPTLERWLS
jgi:hypothetical protein